MERDKRMDKENKENMTYRLSYNYVSYICIYAYKSIEKKSWTFQYKLGE